jgi:CheY-like chemotaxis protein
VTVPNDYLGMKLRSFPHVLAIVCIVLLSGIAGFITISWQWQQQAYLLQVKQLCSSVSNQLLQHLAQNDNESVKQQLVSSQYNATLPIRALAVFDDENQLIAATAASEDLLSEPRTIPTQLQFLELTDGSTLVLVPIWNSMIGPNELPLSTTQQQAQRLGYLLIQLETPSFLGRSIVLLLPIAVALCVVFLLLGWFGRERLADTHRQLGILVDFYQHDETNTAALSSARVYGPFKNLMMVISEREALQAQKYRQLQQAHVREIQNLQQSLLMQRQEHQVDLEKLQQAQSLQWQHQQDERWWLQYAAAADQRSDGQLRWHCRLLADYRRLLPEVDDHTATTLWFPQWFYQKIQFIQSVSTKAWHVEFIEDSRLYQQQIAIPQAQLEALLMLVLDELSLLADEHGIELSYQCVGTTVSFMQLRLKYNGPSPTGSWLADLSKSSHHDSLDSPYALVLTQRLLAVMRADITVATLQDVGTSLQIQFPIQFQRSSQQLERDCHSILLVDPRRSQADSFRHALSAISEQCHVTSQISAVPAELKQRLFDVVVVILIEEPEVSQLRLLQELSQAVTLLCFADAPLDPQLFAEPWMMPVQPVMAEAVRQALQRRKRQTQRLLIVDDNATNLAFVRNMLSSHDLQVDTAVSAAEAIKQAKLHSYDMMLMDIQLPDMSGTEATQHIRQLRNHQKTQILAFTAHALPEEIVQFKAVGMDDVVLKPLDAAKLVMIQQRLKQLSQRA